MTQQEPVFKSGQIVALLAHDFFNERARIEYINTAPNGVTIASTTIVGGAHDGVSVVVELPGGLEHIENEG
jgi:hypothetical protein